MGLTPNPYNPCIYASYIHNPSNDLDNTSPIPIMLGLYVDDFVFFPNSTDVENKFQRILSQLINVEFMGTVEWFLGTHFSWNITPTDVEFQLNQSGFSHNLVESFHANNKSPTPTATPY